MFRLVVLPCFDLCMSNSFHVAQTQPTVQVVTVWQWGMYVVSLSGFVSQHPSRCS